MKKLISVVTVFVLLIGTTTVAHGYTSGYAGISDYGNCPFKDRAGAQYVQNLQSAIRTKCNQKFMLTNENANKYVFGSGWSNSVDFFAFSGHGQAKANYNALHFRSVGNDALDHNSADHADPDKLAKIEARTTEIRLGGTLKYATFYTCNFLTNGGSTEKQTEIYNMFEGARLVVGFASRMFLDSREGTMYGNKLISGTYSVGDAFIAAAQRYQAQRSDADSIARVVGFCEAFDDKFTDAESVLPEEYWYCNEPDFYEIIDTVTIPHTGSLPWP